MIISHQKRFVMLLPWKTASQTLALRLRPYNQSQYDMFFYFNAYLNRVVHQHVTCAEFACLPESRLGYFTASFVRNPYDRVYSGFRQLQKDIQGQPHASYPEPWIRDHVMKQLTENLAQLRQAQFMFDNWLELVGEEQVYEIGRNTNFPLHPSHYWTHVAGQQVVDLIGRVENFETDFQEFLLRVNIDRMQPANANISESGDDAAHSPFGYRYVDRMSARSIEKVNRLFERDFDLFNYARLAR
ncbi:MAG: sulfotransferase family 2 domain-containing protein [Anaerolineales bacterium]